MSDAVRVVLDRGTAMGIPEALRAVPGVDLLEPDTDDAVVAALGSCHALVTFRWLPEFLVPGLRWVQAASAGVDQFPRGALREAGVVLTSARGVHGPQVAEHAFGMLLALTRSIADAVRCQSDRRWHRPEVTELAGRTLGILGLGTIGEAVAVRAEAFGMRVIGTKRDPGTYSGVAEAVFGPEGTIDVCREADVVVVALPSGADTTRLVGRAELEALGPGWLINVGRGPVVDEAALVGALRSGSLAGAGLDVFEEEPLPAESPLWELPNVVVSPHCAGISPHYGARLAEIVAENVRAFRGEIGWVNRVV
jgi:phosphoglycerate dehydrogenase-like enzyme